MKPTISILQEPELEFRFGQKVHDPHDGLALFGPYDTDTPSHPKNITYGVIGTAEGIKAFKKWSEALNLPILPEPDEDNKIWPPYPGFEAIFHSTWPETPAWSHKINTNQLIEASKNLDHNKRTYDVVDLYLSALKIAKKKDEAFGVMVCVVPDEVWKNCRPESKVKDGTGFSIPKRQRDLRAKGQTDIFEDYDPEQYQLSKDFRRQLKARAMQFEIPIQIIRESTLRPHPKTHFSDRGLTPKTDRAWNLSSTLYYKAGGKPWRLSTAREGVCYIGIAFRRTDKNKRGPTACCAAQMFLDTGDGIVFLGENGPWYSPINKQCHLTKDAATNLLSGVLKTYEELDGRKLTEIFLHSRSSINKNEFEGYKKACPNGVKVVGIHVRTERIGLRLFRPGAWPVIRGTFLKLNNRTGFLWASGFKTRLETYDGWETPTPLRIDIEHGNAEIEQVTKDIFGLTKLNYNACKLGDSKPVTIGFSDAVGEILVTNPTIKTRHPNFKFYI